LKYPELLVGFVPAERRKKLAVEFGSLVSKKKPKLTKENLGVKKNQKTSNNIHKQEGKNESLEGVTGEI